MNRMTKRIAAILLAVMLSLALAACGGCTMPTTDNGNDTDHAANGDDHNEDELITVMGTVINNMDVYNATYEAYRTQYNSVGIRTFGIRFASPVTLTSGETITEAEFPNSRIGNQDLESIDAQGMITVNNNLVNVTLTFSGYLRLIPDHTEFSKVTDGRYTVDYFYAPNGPYEFIVVSAQ